jgi:hypothetical protein
MGESEWTTAKHSLGTGNGRLLALLRQAILEAEGAGKWLELALLGGAKDRI